MVELLLLDFLEQLVFLQDQFFQLKFAISYADAFVQVVLLQIQDLAVQVLHVEPVELLEGVVVVPVQFVALPDQSLSTGVK